MVDPFVLLTPIMMLGVMALLGFVGCDSVFGIETLPDPPIAPLTPFVTSMGVGMKRKNFTGWVGMTIRVGASPLTVAELGRFSVPPDLNDPPSSGTHSLKIVDAATGLDLPSGDVTVSMAGVTPGTFKYGALTSPITLIANTDYYVVSLETNVADDPMADQFYHSNTVVLTTVVASVQTAVFRSGMQPYVREATAGHTFGPLDFKYQA